MTTTQTPRHKVVVIGSGFGGLFGTKALRRADVDVTVIAKTTHHLFQPLLYQVATGILSEGEIAPPTREILSGQDNARVILGEVTGIDLAARTVTSQVLGRDTVTSYDSLLVAAGASQSYFGNDHFAEFAPGMKSIDDALELRGRIFGAFEMAELGATRGDDVDHLPDLRGRRCRPDRRGDGRPDRRARAPHAAQGLPRDQHPHRPRRPRRRRAAGAAALRRQARREGQGRAGEARRRGDARRHGHRGRRARPRGEVQGRPRRADQLGRQDLGRRRAGQPARQDAVGADRRPARPRRPHRGQPRPHAARATPRSSSSAT